MGPGPTALIQCLHKGLLQTPPVCCAGHTARAHVTVAELGCQTWQTGSWAVNDYTFATNVPELGCQTMPNWRLDCQYIHTGFWINKRCETHHTDMCAVNGFMFGSQSLGLVGTSDSKKGCYGVMTLYILVSITVKHQTWLLADAYMPNV